MAEILITHGIPQEGFSLLKGHRLVIPEPLCAFSEEELIRRIQTADAVVAGGRLSGKVIQAGKRLRIIANYGAGYDGVDIECAKSMGIPVTNIPDTVTQATAELAFGLMLAVSRRISEMNLRMRSGAPEELFGMGKNMGNTLFGRTLGIIGCGRIGKKVSALAQAFGMRVVGYSRNRADEAYFMNVDFEQLLSQSDIVSLHCPLTEETHSIMNEGAFERMKPGAILINTSRGAVVDHAALVRALQSGRLSGAGLDVYPDEPHVPQALLKLENVVLTPHIGANTKETRFAMAQACAEQILSALKGERPENIVNGL